MFGNDNQNNQQQKDTTNNLGTSSFLNDPVSSGSLSSDDNVSSPATSNDESSSSTAATSTPSVPDSTSLPTVGGTSDDLLSIKQSALQDLTPLVDHIDQTPEEKFRTTMMMIQASDDQSLIKTAYEAAQNIKDDKARAQALLDVVNEINYFTQQHHVES